jgi:hypothetical protein
VAGRSTGAVGTPTYNAYVHLTLNAELTRIAVGKGLGNFKMFTRYPKVEKTKSIRISAPKKKQRKSSLVGMGLRLASLFDTETIDIEEEHEITEYEEIDTGTSL